MGIQTKKLSAPFILKRLFGFTEQVRGEMAECIAGGIVSGLAKIGIYICTGMLLAIASGQAPGKSLTGPGIMIVICTILIPITYYFEMFKGHDVAYHLLAILRTQMFGEIERLSPAKLTGERKGNIISTLMADVDTLEIFFAHTIAPIATAIVCAGVSSSVFPICTDMPSTAVICFSRSLRPSAAYTYLMIWPLRNWIRMG